ncbi:MAG: ABC transporter ATP-binding protein [Chloroflexi bacterium]|nr:ABC transporter ATP-binding protein [Chloroflexota bacterium]
MTLPVAEARALHVQDVSVEFHGRPVLSGVNLDLNAGRVICLVGRSGCGKTTLLRVVAGLQAPTSGRVDVIHPGHASGRWREIAMVFQSDSLFPWMTAEQNVMFAMSASGAPKSGALNRARSELARVGLADAGHLRPRQLSGGMRQRVNLARALATDPRILLMDEPFSALDYLTREDVQDLTGRLIADRVCTVIFVTHDIPEAVFLGDEIMVMTQEARGIASTIRAPWPRPRDPDIKRSHEFQQIVADVQRLIL